MSWRALVIATLVVIALGPSAVAQPAAPAAVPIDEQIAVALYERGVELFAEGDVRRAKELFIESVERSPSGARADDARAMVRNANERLGIEDLDDGLPGGRGGDTAPLDPYQDGGAGDGGAEESGGGAAGDGAEPDGDPGVTAAIDRYGLTGWAGGLGVVTGLAIGGPAEDGNLRGLAVATGLAGGAGLAGLGYWLTGRYSLSAGESAAIASAGTWGSVNFAFLGDVFTGRSSDTSDVFKIMAAGGLAGTGGGILYAVYGDPQVGDVAFANSLSTWGIGAGLLLGVMISPPRNEAYSLNAFFGSVAGLTTGVLLRNHVDMSRKRTLWLDAGAAAGAAATWVLIYPLIADGGTNDDEQLAGGLSTLTMAGGVVGAWLLTAHLGIDDDDGDEAGESATALLSRSPDGNWHGGGLRLQPMATPRGGMSVGVRLLDGKF